MKKIYSLALLLPLLASCSQDDEINKIVDDPVVKSPSIRVESLPLANDDTELPQTRVYSGTTRDWEAPVAGSVGYVDGKSDRIGLAWHRGWSGSEVSHGGLKANDYSPVPKDITYIGCKTDKASSDEIVWEVTSDIYVGKYCAYYPSKSVMGKPEYVEFDISKQKLKTSETQAYADGSIYMTNELIGTEEFGSGVSMTIRLKPVSSLMQLFVDMSAYSDIEVKSVTVTNVGTGFRYVHPVEKADEGFGFSTSARANQRTAREAINEGFMPESNYKTGTITLSGMYNSAETLKPNASGILPLYIWYLPQPVANKSALAKPVVTIEDTKGNKYEVQMTTDLTTAANGDYLMKFNAGFRMGTSTPLKVVKK